MTVKEAISLMEYRISTAEKIIGNQGLDDMRMAVEALKEQSSGGDRVLFVQGRVYYSQNQVKDVIEKTVKAIIKCDEGETASKCKGCFLQTKDKGCVKNILGES